MNLVETDNYQTYELVVVGTGFFGATIARLFADTYKRPVLILEKRNHIGGNAWSEFDPQTGIEIHKYGSHLFHTNNERVWQFVNRFDSFTNYSHKVFTKHQNQFYPMPINLLTISTFFGRAFTPREAKQFFDGFRNSHNSTINFESEALKSVGKDLYEAFYRGYTTKQWQVDPADLPKEIFTRIPIRYDFNQRYFDDKYEGLPSSGYGTLLTRILTDDNIHVALRTDYFDFKEHFKDKLVIYTGPLDRYFDFSHGVLGWRTLDFELEYVPVNDFQGNSVVNYADLDVPYTRIHEFKHLHPERQYTSDKTVIMKEFSRKADANDEPYYPINSTFDRELLEHYRLLARSESKVLFGGRLGTYKYLDMHMAIASAFSMFENVIREKFAS